MTTPGSTIDVLVTEAGIAVSPLREELGERLKRSGLPVKPIEQLQREALALSPWAPTHEPQGRIVGIVEYRDGSVIDVVRMNA